MTSQSKEDITFKQLFDRCDGETQSKDGWGEHGGYMKAKNEKLARQFGNLEPRKSTIFHGISIWVNGYTNPSSDALKKIMALHGGNYEHFFLKTKVTHIIATNLPNSKIKNLKKNDKVVHPDWIVDSVKAGRLLALDRYLLYSVAKRDGAVLKFQRTDTTYDSILENQNLVLESNKEPLFIGDSELESHTPQSIDEDFDVNDTEHHETPNHVTSAVPNLSKHNYSSMSASKNPLKAGDDNFISEYYTHSRLHHLSMWKAELKKFASNIQRKQNNQTEKIPYNQTNKHRLIMHVDLDSFFVSVALKLNPDLKGKPVAVCHSGVGNTERKDFANSWSAIASCSYEAREFGLKNGMMLNEAKGLCPQLICVPYNFDEYRNVSQCFYEILSHFTCNIEAVSCDEALLDVTQLVDTDDCVLELAERIRSEIVNETGCIASCGIGNSILIARLATKQAKPNGKCYISSGNIPAFIECQKVKDLPGIGWVQGKKLETLKISTCKDLKRFTLAALQKEFGPKLGETLFQFCRGKDDRNIKMDQERKSVSAEINYGLRFKEYHEVEKFVHQLSSEVEKRLKDIRKKGKHITIKLMTRRKDAKDPMKFMGHGWCEHLSRSCSLPIATDNIKVISEKCCSILHTLQIKAEDFRGMGIQITKLSDATKQSSHSKSLLNFTKPMSAEEYHDLDKSHHAASKQDTFVVGSSKKTMTLDNFVRPGLPLLSPFTNDTLKHQALPPLPSLEICPPKETRRSGNTSSVQNYSSLQGATMDWDPAVLEELPEDIKMELKMYHSRAATSTMTAGSSSSISKNVSPPKVSHSKSQSPKISPSTGRKGKQKRLRETCDSSKYFDIRAPAKKIIAKNVQFTMGHPVETGKELVERKFERSDSGALSPSKIDLGVVNELPDEIRNEIISNMRRTGHLSRHNKINKTITKMVATDQTSPSKHNVENIQETHPQANELINESHSATSTSITSDQFLISPSQLDQSVLRALPDDLRQVILHDAESCKRDSHRPFSSSLLLHTNNNSFNNQPVQRSDILLSPSQLDVNVLAALPIDLQNEVIQNAEFEKKRRLKKKENEAIIVPTLEQNIQEEANEPVRKIRLTQVLPEICGISNYEDVKKMLRRWVKEYEEPLTDDVEELLVYLEKLITTYNMETLLLVLKSLKRITMPLQSWHFHFNNILQSIQNVMKTEYSGVLSISPHTLSTQQ